MIMLWLQKILPWNFTSGNFCHLLLTFANSLDPEQDRQNVCPDLDLDLNRSTLSLVIMSLKDFFEKVDFEKNQQHEKLPR